MWSYAIVEPRQFRKVDAPTPTADALVAGDVLLRTLAGGICGSDLGAFRGERSGPHDRGRYAPNLPGFSMHEVVGEVVASRHPEIAAGSNVVGWARDFNGIAEYVVTDGDGLATYDPALPAHIAVLLQPLACVLYAVDQLADLPVRRAAVLGQGPIGVLFSHVLKDRGCTTVTGVDVVDRRDLAATFHVDEMIFDASDQWSAQLSDGERPDVVIEAIGHQAGTFGDAIDAVAPGGQIYYFGIPDPRPYPMDLRLFLRKQLTLRAGTTLCRHRYLTLANQYLARHPSLTNDYVTHTFDVAHLQHAYEAACTPTTGRLKVTVKMAQPGG